MVEFIGIVVAACAAWFLWRAIVARLLPRMMSRGAAYAQEHGAVPLEFSADLLRSPGEVKVARAWICIPICAPLVRTLSRLSRVAKSQSCANTKTPVVKSPPPPTMP